MSFCRYSFSLVQHHTDPNTNTDTDTDTDTGHCLKLQFKDTMMLLFRKSFLVLLLLQASSDNAVVIATTTKSGRQIDSVASAGNTIHFEQDIDLSSLAYRTTIDVISSVPVTVERYNDNAYYLEGQQPRK